MEDVCLWLERSAGITGALDAFRRAGTSVMVRFVVPGFESRIIARCLPLVCSHARGGDYLDYANGCYFNGEGVAVPAEWIEAVEIVETNQVLTLDAGPC